MVFRCIRAGSGTREFGIRRRRLARAGRRGMCRSSARPMPTRRLNLTLGAGAIPMIFTNPPVVTPVAGTNGQEAFIFNYNFDTDAPTIYKGRPVSGKPDGLHDRDAAGCRRRQFCSRAPRKNHHDDLVNDGIFSAVDLAEYFNLLNLVMGGRADDFARLFMIPNMAHCGAVPRRPASARIC